MKIKDRLTCTQCPGAFFRKVVASKARALDAAGNAPGFKGHPDAGCRKKFAIKRSLRFFGFFSEFFFPNSVLLYFFGFWIHTASTPITSGTHTVLLYSILGLWSGFINPPLQSLVNPYFSQSFERLFSKKKHERKSPQGWGVVKCREFERKNPLKWVVSILRDYWINFDIT